MEVFLKRVNDILYLINNRLPFCVDSIIVPGEQLSGTSVAIKIYNLTITCTEKANTLFINNMFCMSLHYEEIDRIATEATSFILRTEEYIMKIKEEILHITEKIKESIALQQEQNNMLLKLFAHSDEVLPTQVSTTSVEDILELQKQGNNILRLAIEYQPGSMRVKNIEEHFKSMCDKIE
jgi:hypothetical protein